MLVLCHAVPCWFYALALLRLLAPRRTLLCSPVPAPPPPHPSMFLSPLPVPHPPSSALFHVSFGRPGVPEDTKVLCMQSHPTRPTLVAVGTTVGVFVFCIAPVYDLRATLVRAGSWDVMRRVPSASPPQTRAPDAPASLAASARPPPPPSLPLTHTRARTRRVSRVPRPATTSASGVFNGPCMVVLVRCGDVGSVVLHGVARGIGALMLVP